MCQVSRHTLDSRASKVLRSQKRTTAFKVGMGIYLGTEVTMTIVVNVGAVTKN